MEYRIPGPSVAAGLKPFWRYYGGKWRAAPRYPSPTHGTIVEPFAGAAGYSMRYPDRNVILVEKYPVVAGIWRYLIRVSPEEIRRIPEVEHVDDLPAWVPGEARDLYGWWLNNATAVPSKQLSAGRKKLRSMGRKFEGWTPDVVHRIASQVEHIRHWRVIEGDWSDAPDVEATWFVDPPYNNKAGSHYKHGPDAVDFAALGTACRSRFRGQVIVCENEGADWLPFRPFMTSKAGPRSPGKGSSEVIWKGGRVAMEHIDPIELDQLLARWAVWEEEASEICADELVYAFQACIEGLRQVRDAAKSKANVGIMIVSGAGSVGIKL